MKSFKKLLPICVICVLALLLNSCGIVYLLTADTENTVYEYNEDTEYDDYEYQDNTDKSSGILESPEDDGGEVSTPLMWRVSGNGFGGSFYLLGSIHVGLEDTNLYPDEVYDAYNSCEYLAVESDIIELEADMEAQINSIQFFLYNDGTLISDHIDKALYSEAKILLESYGIYDRYFDYYTPVMWEQMIDQILTEETVYEYDYGVDRYFLTQSKKLGKEIIEIEDYIDTYAALGSLSDGTQEFLLREAVDPEYIESYSDNLSELYGYWKRGVLSETEEYFYSDDGNYTAAETEMLEEYNRALLTDRNEVMLDRAEDYLSDDMDVFYIVGLAHMLGDDGLVAGLTDAGYTVELVGYAD